MPNSQSCFSDYSHQYIVDLYQRAAAVIIDDTYLRYAYTEHPFNTCISVSCYSSTPVLVYNFSSRGVTNKPTGSL